MGPCGLFLTWTIPALLLLPHCHSHQRGSETFHVSAGHLFVLKCDSAGDLSNVSWSRQEQDLRETPGVEVQDGLLWFRPVQSEHRGTYTCHMRSHSGEYEMHFELSVSSEKCPDPAESKYLSVGETWRIPCKQNHIYSLNTTKNIRWMKGCSPVQRAEGSLWVDYMGQLWFPGVAPEDAGIYTCLIDLNVEGQNYTAARSIEVTITSDTVYVVPHIIYPRDKVVEVDMGSRVELKCLADFGYNKDSQAYMYWLVNGTYSEDYPELIEPDWDYVDETPQRRLQALSTLIISTVHSGFLNVPIVCLIKNPAGVDQGALWLREADHSAFYLADAWCLSVSLGLLVLVAALYFFKVDLVLAYRAVRRRFKHHVSDEEWYDAFVSWLRPPGLTPPELSSFTLQLLPQRLEQQCGYRLYISGRDDCPGEAMHDAISETLQRSRRLLLLLCASGPEGVLQASEDHQPLCYEHRVGLYDALTKKEPRVILVEIGGPVNYSRLPESVQYLRRKQGVLQWRIGSRRRLSVLSSERSFWKNLRYHMPPVPSGRGQPRV